MIIKVTEKAGYNNYSETTFDDAESLGLNENQIREILNSAHDLTEFIPEVKSNQDIKNILDKHWFGTSSTPDDEMEEEPEIETPKKKINLTTTAADDEIPMGNSKSTEDDDLDSLLEDV